MFATNQKVCAVVTVLMPNMFPVFSIRNQSLFIISKETVVKFFPQHFAILMLTSLPVNMNICENLKDFFLVELERIERCYFFIIYYFLLFIIYCTLKSKSPAHAGSVPFSIYFPAKGRRAQLSFALVSHSEQFVWEPFTFG